MSYLKHCLDACEHFHAGKPFDDGVKDFQTASQGKCRLNGGIREAGQGEQAALDDKHKLCEERWPNTSLW